MTTRATKTAHAMHATQAAYALALVSYEAARDAAGAECAEKGLVIVAGMADDAWETTSSAIDDVEIAHNVWSLQTAKVEAERAMILWSLDASEKSVMPGSEAAEAVELIRDRVECGKTRSKEWTQLVNLAFKLAA